MTRRKAVRIALGELVQLFAHPTDRSFAEWRCRLCAHRAGAVDQTAALTAAAIHLQEGHRAHGGHPITRTRRRRHAHRTA